MSDLSIFGVGIPSFMSAIPNVISQSIGGCRTKADVRKHTLLLPTGDGEVEVSNNFAFSLPQAMKITS
jgi:hypothetical protein